MTENKLAMYFEKAENSKVHCYLCPHNCVIMPGKTGVCGVRKNIDGNLYSVNYGKITSLGIDPVEKKPLNRFYPGSYILSAGTFGCNLKCSFCQNWSIAHGKADVIDMTPEELVKRAQQLKSRNNIGIAYTYNEPSIWYEHVFEASKMAHAKGLVNVMVTNGFINREPLEELLPYIDAMNIDVKAFTESFYSSICKAALSDVKRTVETAAKKCHIELTTLVIPDLNDSIEEIEELVKWIASVSDEIPLHLSRFFPGYQMRNRPVTPKETLYRAKDKAEEYLKYVYLGNI